MRAKLKARWKACAELSRQSGVRLVMAIAGSPGWSESGGPRAPAKDGMKRYVWTETRVRGGQPYERDVAGNHL